MKEIKCPKCGEVFQVDESGYAQILSQVRDGEFQKEVEKRAKELAKQQELELEANKLKIENEQKDALAKKDTQIADKERVIDELKNQIKNSEMEKKLAIADAVQQKEKELSQKDVEITKLKGDLGVKDSENQLAVKAIKDEYEGALKLKDDEINMLKDYKAKMSTKMVGESLEQYCKTEFDKIRMAAFPNAYFDKDNDIKSGTKGDFIFRESGEDGTEFISIMFEMKNENETTATKHKNEDFFAKLDKDRKDKKCEYAVLVSMLEADNDLYNNGIVDVSYVYDKMYVVRPQFFIPIISLLRNAAKNTLKYKQELAVIQNEQLDYSNFEANMMEFKDKFGKNYETASKKFGEAIDEIDKSIAHLQKIKSALMSSENQLRLANDKAQDLTIKKLTKNAPSIRAMLENKGK